MYKGKMLKIQRAPSDWEIIGQEEGFAKIAVAVTVEDNINDDTDFEIPFSEDKMFARIVNEESGESVSSPVRLLKNGSVCECVIDKIPCGGPYLLDFIILDKANNIDCPLVCRRRRHFYVGDVYIIAGQSNAAGMAKGFLTEEAEKGIHVLRNMEYWDIATQPFNDLDYSKYGMFISFAKKLKKETGRPIGLIPAAMGGAPLSRWLKDENGDLSEKLVNTLKEKGIKPKAVLWYQGCSDVWEDDDPRSYIERFKRFTGFLREDLKCEKLPFFTFQLNRQKFKENDPENGLRYDCLREAQRLAAKEINNVYVIPSIDSLIMTDFIHNGKASNVMLGERLALNVLDKLYGIGKGADAPEILSGHLEGDKIILRFANVSEFLYAFNVSPECFPIKIEDGSGIIGIKDYEISGDTVKLFLKRKAEGGVFVSGQSGNSPENIIEDYGTGIPMLCFYKFRIEE